MTVRRVDDATIELEGVCFLEDVDPLLQHLSAAPRSTIDWRSCDAAHAAIIQLMLAAGVAVFGQPRGEFLKNMVDPLFSHV